MHAPIRRNDRCPCGSGRKYKKCCLGTKDRSVVVWMDFGEPVEANEIMITPGGQAILRKDGRALTPVRARIDLQAPRAKGPKVLSRADLEPASLEINPSIALRRFDRLFALDTNTVTVDGERISVTCIVRCDFRDYDRRVLALYWPVQAVEFRNVQGDPERIAWRAILESMREHKGFNPAWKVGIVVDSAVADLEAFNARTKAVIGDWFLPAGFTLAYAGADAAAASLGNLLISKCDKNAAAILRYLRATPRAGELMTVENEPYTHVRAWVLRTLPNVSVQRPG